MCFLEELSEISILSLFFTFQSEDSPQTSPPLSTSCGDTTIKYKIMDFGGRKPNLKIISIHYQYPRAGTILISQGYFKNHYIPVYMCSQPGLYTNIAIHMVFSH